MPGGTAGRFHREVNGIPAKVLIGTGATMTVLTRHDLALPSMASLAGNRGRTEGVTSPGHLLAVDSLPDRADVAYKRLEGVLA